MYIPYGTLDGIIKNEDVKDCIGYIIQNEHVTSVVDLENKDTRVYTLVGDDDENYLMVYYIGTTLMNQPDFYRAIDTKGVEINTPKYISSQDYLIWK
jgi:hypothetical protein